MKMIRVVMVICGCLLAGDVLASGYLRPRTNAPPPVVPDPVVTNTPAPPAQVPRSWSYSELWKKGLPWKVMVAHDVPRGTVVSYYNRSTRTDSRIEERGPSGWKTIWDGDEETIGESPTLGAAPWDGGLVFAAERGKNFLRYDNASGKMSRLAKVPDGYKWNIYPAAWKARNTVAVGADGPDKKAAVFDALTGRKLFDSPLDGLVAGMAEDSSGIMWLAISDGQQGICNSSGYASRDLKPASVAHFAGRTVAGSMVDGWLWRLDGSKWVKWLDLDCSKVNKLVADKRRDVLLVAGSNPDTFAAIHPDGTVERIARFTDQKKSVSGEQFDATIDQGAGESVILGRANDSGCYVYRGSMK